MFLHCSLPVPRATLREVETSLPAGFRVRPAVTDDIDLILHHRAAMFREMNFIQDDGVDLMHRVTREYLELALPEGRYRGWLIENPDGQVIAGGGIVLADWPGHPYVGRPVRAWILNMFTEPEARRLGLARFLVESMIEWCREQQLGVVSLHASQFGRPLYESLGFTPTNEMRLKL